MLKWVEETKFERLGIFTYSHEENTHAHLLKDDVSEKVKKQRADAVMKLQQEISYNLNQEKIGKTYKTLIDRKEGPYYIGRSEFDSPDVDNEVLVKASDDIHLRLGDFVNVKINEANDFDLFGELI